MQRTADYIAGLFLGGDAAKSDLKAYILEYGETMALAAVAAEREACAKIADDASPPSHQDGQTATGQRMACRMIAAAIRARSTLKG